MNLVKAAGARALIQGFLRSSLVEKQTVGVGKSFPLAESIPVQKAPCLFFFNFTTFFTLPHVFLTHSNTTEITPQRTAMPWNGKRPSSAGPRIEGAVKEIFLDVMKNDLYPTREKIQAVIDEKNLEQNSLQVSKWMSNQRNMKRQQEANENGTAYETSRLINMSEEQMQKKQKKLYRRLTAQKNACMDFSEKALEYLTILSEMKNMQEIPTHQECEMFCNDMKAWDREYLPTDVRLWFLHKARKRMSTQQSNELKKRRRQEQLMRPKGETKAERVMKVKQDSRDAQAKQQCMMKSKNQDSKEEVKEPPKFIDSSSESENEELAQAMTVAEFNNDLGVPADDLWLDLLGEV